MCVILESTYLSALKHIFLKQNKSWCPQQ